MAELSQNKITATIPLLKVVLYVNSKMLALTKKSAQSDSRETVELDGFKLRGVKNNPLRKMKNPALHARRKERSGRLDNDAASIVEGIATNNERTI